MAEHLRRALRLHAHLCAQRLAVEARHADLVARLRSGRGGGERGMEKIKCGNQNRAEYTQTSATSSFLAVKGHSTAGQQAHLAEQRNRLREVLQLRLCPR